MSNTIKELEPSSHISHSLDAHSGDTISYEELSHPKGYIYHLLNETDKIVYIGSSVNILHRLTTHASEGKKIFHYARFWKVPRHKMIEIEIEQILFHNPIYNIALPINDKYFTLEKFKTINPVVKGKSIKIRKIMQQKMWEFRRGYLEKWQWEEIAHILAMGGENE